MKHTIKRKLKVYLPMALTFVLVGVILLVFLLMNKVTAKDYFNALQESNYTKQVQQINIVEGGVLVYEKVETIVLDNNNVYHKIYERKLSSDPNVDYDETTTEFYYSQTTMFYFENNVWKSKEFNISEKTHRYVLRSDYFSNFEFQKEIESEGVLKGQIKNDKTKHIVDIKNLKDMTVSLIVNKDFQIKNFEIKATTDSNRNLIILNTYSYLNETVNMPV